MTPKEVRLHFGSVIAAATALDITPQAFYRWMDRGHVPLGRQYEIQVMSGGRLQAEKPAKASA